MSEATPVDTAPPPANRLPDEFVQDTKTQSSRRTMTIVGVVAAVVVILIILGFVWMLSAGVTGTVRDVVIILLAVESLLLVGLTLYLVVQMTLLVRMMRNELMPLIKSAQETVNSARGTTRFVGQKIVKPTAEASANVARLTRMFQVLFRGK